LRFRPSWSWLKCLGFDLRDEIGAAQALALEELKILNASLTTLRSRLSARKQR
jgi:hypothetical protein